jgi:Tfp pilus assembly protein PilF
LRGLEHDPQAILAYFFLGLTYARTGRPRAAEQNLEKALIGGNPRVAQAHLILAELFMKSREFSKARQHLEVYLKIRPEDPQADHIRAVLTQLKSEANP